MELSGPSEAGVDKLPPLPARLRYRPSTPRSARMADSDYILDDEADKSATPWTIVTPTSSSRVYSSQADVRQTAVIRSLRALVSKPAQKAYLGTFLFIITSILMLCVSAVAYWIFYYKFIPQVGLERVVHLQFGYVTRHPEASQTNRLITREYKLTIASLDSDGPPWGTASLGSDLVSLQPYDVNVNLELPRTPSNLAAGNFMLDLTLFSHPSTSARTDTNTSTSAISRSRRPAILSYASPMIDTASKISLMPLYVTGWHREAETLKVGMMERVEFPRGWRNLPESLRLEIQSEERMQIYSARVQFRARFTGLRYVVMANPV